MTDDLVKRLRRWPPPAPTAVVWPADLLREAADRIAALVAERKLLQGRLAKAHASIAALEGKPHD